MRRRVVGEFLDFGKTVKGGLDDASLHAAPSSVNYANLAKTSACGRLDVSLDY